MASEYQWYVIFLFGVCICMLEGYFFFVCPEICNPTKSSRRGRGSHLQITLSYAATQLWHSRGFRGQYYTTNGNILQDRRTGRKLYYSARLNCTDFCSWVKAYSMGKDAHDVDLFWWRLLRGLVWLTYAIPPYLMLCGF